jgi:shikimate kinase
MLNLKTKHIIKSRYVVWLNKSFGEWSKKIEEVNNKFYEHNEDENEVIEEIRKEPDGTVDAGERNP